MSNSDNKDELNGMGCIYATLIPLAIFLIGMVFSIATGGTTDSLLNIDSSEYPSKIFYGFWFLVVAVIVVLLLNKKDNKSKESPSPVSYRNYDSENQYLDDEIDYFPPESENSPSMEMFDPGDDVQKKVKKKGDDSNKRNPYGIDDPLSNKSSSKSRQNLGKSIGKKNTDLPYCKDYHGNKYRYVDVGEIRWCIDNFKGKKFLDGEEIQEALNIKQWNQFYEKGIPAFYEHSPKSLDSYEIVYNYYVLVHKDLVTDYFGVPNPDDIDNFNDLVKSGGLHDPIEYKLIQDSFEDVFTINIENTKAHDQPQKRKFWVFGDFNDNVLHKTNLDGEGDLYRDKEGNIPVQNAHSYNGSLHLIIERKSFANPGFMIKLCKSLIIRNRLKRAINQDTPPL